MKDTLANVGDGENDLVKSFEQAFGGGLSGGAFWLTGNQTRSGALEFVEFLAGLKLNDGEDASGEGEQTGQTNDMIIAFEAKWAEGEGAAFDAGEVVLNQKFIAIGLNSGRQ